MGATLLQRRKPLRHLRLIAASTFDGPKAGYNFKNGEQGLGYYFDSLDKIVRGPAFIPAEKFEGPKPGYRFSNGGQGVGYYIDEKPVVPVSKTDGVGVGAVKVY